MRPSKNARYILVAALLPVMFYNARAQNMDDTTYQHKMALIARLSFYNMKGLDTLWHTWTSNVFGDRSYRQDYYGWITQRNEGDLVLAELEKFLCGASNSKYKEQRKHVGTGVKVGLGAVSTSIASILGVPSTVIMPVIVLIILSGGQITVNAWCEMRKKQRKDQENSDKEL